MRGMLLLLPSPERGGLGPKDSFGGGVVKNTNALYPLLVREGSRHLHFSKGKELFFLYLQIF
jgi:hypothetical protein